MEIIRSYLSEEQQQPAGFSDALRFQEMTTAIVAACKSVLGVDVSTQILELAKASRGPIEELVGTEDSGRPDRLRHDHREGQRLDTEYAFIAAQAGARRSSGLSTCGQYAGALRGQRPVCQLRRSLGYDASKLVWKLSTAEQMEAQEHPPCASSK